MAAVAVAAVVVVVGNDDNNDTDDGDDDDIDIVVDSEIDHGVGTVSLEHLRWLCWVSNWRDRMRKK